MLQKSNQDSKENYPNVRVSTFVSVPCLFKTSWPNTAVFVVGQRFRIRVIMCLSRVIKRCQQYAWVQMCPHQYKDIFP